LLKSIYTFFVKMVRRPSSALGTLSKAILIVLTVLNALQAILGDPQAFREGELKRRCNTLDGGMSLLPGTIVTYQE